MSEQRIDNAAAAAATTAADPGEGQGLQDLRSHPTGTQPGGGAETGDAPLTKDFQEPEGAPPGSDVGVGETEGVRSLLEQHAKVEAQQEQGPS